MFRMLLFCLLLYIIPLTASVKNVPADVITIQIAIDAAKDGDTVIVSEGIYYENINFRGKKIIVASLYFSDGDVNHIKNTIINGSQPLNADTASCVLFINGEDASSQLIGFTLTGGKGTRWTDEHGAGIYYEGGGILSALSSPTIKNNIIINNEAIRKSSSASAGGGGIRSGDGSPRILNNIIINNRGMYGGGIVLNYCAGAIVKNNIIVQNSVYQAVASTPTYGGGGLWINNQLPQNNTVNVIENNNIIGNSSSGTTPAGYAGYGGGVYITGSKVSFINNIVWNNIQSKGKQFNLASGTITVTYNNIHDGYTGLGNISTDPGFADSSFYLKDGSAMIDAGNPDSTYNDPTDPMSPGNALFPSKGSVRSDIGVYGGKLRTDLPSVSLGKVLFINSSLNFGNVVQGTSKTLGIYFYNSGGTKLLLDSVGISLNVNNQLTVPGNFQRAIIAGGRDSVNVVFSPILTGSLLDTLLIYFNGNTVPVNVPLKGTAVITDVNDKTGKLNYYLDQNYPNPFNPTTLIKYSVAEPNETRIKIFNLAGEEIITLVNEFKNAGEYEITWNSKNNNGKLMPSGMYFYKIESGGFSNVKKMLLIR